MALTRDGRYVDERESRLGPCVKRRQTRGGKGAKRLGTNPATALTLNLTLTLTSIRSKLPEVSSPFREDFAEKHHPHERWLESSTTRSLARERARQSTIFSVLRHTFRNKLRRNCRRLHLNPAYI